MNTSSDKKEVELLCMVVNYGFGSKVLKIARNNGISGGTIFLGKGTIKSRLLEFLDLCDTRKEIVLIISEKIQNNHVLEALNKELNLKKSNHGIAFTSSVSKILGVRNTEINKKVEIGGIDDIMYNAIFVVVDKGNAEDVIEAATSAGSRGGTIINARGSGIHETHMLFSMLVEPEKEVVLILSESNLTDAIAASIREHLKIDEQGKGILFIIDVNKAYGLY